MTMTVERRRAIAIDELRGYARAAREGRGLYAIYRTATLRDLRRAIAQRPATHIGAVDTLQCAAISLARAHHGVVYDTALTLAPRVLDALVARFGARAPILDVVAALYPEGQPRTDHHALPVVVEAAGVDPDAPVHGGDGASGDIPAPAETPAQTGQKGGEDHEAASSEAAENATSAASGDTGRSDAQSSEEDCGTEGTISAEVLPRDAAADTTDAPAPATDADPRGTHRDDAADRGGDPGASRGRPAHEAHEADVDTDRHVACDGGGTDGPTEVLARDRGSPRHPVADDARWLLDWAAEHRHTVIRRPSVQAAIAVLRRLSTAVGMASHEPTPRWDARRLARELVSRRCAMHLARRTAPRPSLIVLAVDMSGSCRWIWPITATIALTIADADPRVAVVPHGRMAREGYLFAEAALGRGAEAWRRALSRCSTVTETDYFRETEQPTYWIASEDDWAMARAGGVTHLVALGDVHGSWSYEAAARAGVHTIVVDPNPCGWRPEVDGLSYRRIPRPADLAGPDAIDAVASALADALEGRRL